MTVRRAAAIAYEIATNTGNAEDYSWRQIADAYDTLTQDYDTRMKYAAHIRMLESVLTFDY